jgi:hypothetical protein
VFTVARLDMKWQGSRRVGKDLKGSGIGLCMILSWYSPGRAEECQKGYSQASRVPAGTVVTESSRTRVAHCRNSSRLSGREKGWVSGEVGRCETERR